MTCSASCKSWWRYPTKWLYHATSSEKAGLATSPILNRFIFLIWRLAIACYMFGWLVVSMEDGMESGKWFIYLTNWGFAATIVYFVLAAAVTVRYNFTPALRDMSVYDNLDLAQQTKHAANSSDPEAPIVVGSPDDLEQPQKLPCDFAATFCALAVASTVAVTITLAYWILLYVPGMTPLSGINVNTHLINSISILIDITLSGAPFRLPHIIVNFVFGVVYVLFTVIYWRADPANNIVYSVLDYNTDPTMAAVYELCILFLLMPALHALLTLYAFVRDRYLHRLQCCCATQTGTYA